MHLAEHSSGVITEHIALHIVVFNTLPVFTLQFICLMGLTAASIHIQSTPPPSQALLLPPPSPPSQSLYYLHIHAQDVVNWNV